MSYLRSDMDGAAFDKFELESTLFRDPQSVIFALPLLLRQFGPKSGRPRIGILKESGHSGVYPQD